MDIPKKYLKQTVMLFLNTTLSELVMHRRPWHHQMTNHASYWSQIKSLSISIQLNCGSQPTKSLWVSTHRDILLKPPLLMKYSEIIRDLAARGYNWRYYDENFRYLRQHEPKAYSSSYIMGKAHPSSHAHSYIPNTTFL